MRISGKFGFLAVLVVLALLAVPASAFAQIPTPAAELFDGETAVGTAWPLVIIFLGMLAVPFALVFGKSIVRWVAGLITNYARK